MQLQTIILALFNIGEECFNHEASLIELGSGTGMERTQNQVCQVQYPSFQRTERSEAKPSWLIEELRSAGKV